MNATPSSSDRRRPVPRVCDNLDRLLDLLDRAREEQGARAGEPRLEVPHLVLLEPLEQSA